MIAVADSGSTKCDWIIISNNEVYLETKTMGFNPFYHSSSIIEEEIRKNASLEKHAKDIKQVYFYGAGCSSEDRNKIVAVALRNAFPDLEVCFVEHDLLGACLATAGNEEGIVCITGTGSNSCYFDGEHVFEELPSLGYVLGDEGSGAYLGKKLLIDWLYKKMPTDLANKFSSKYHLDKEGILTSVYNKPNPNVYLASFSPFAGENVEHPYIKELIYNGFADFASIHIQCYEQHKTVPTHFIGSLAYFYKDILDQVAKEYGFSIGRIIKSPIHDLANYHIQKNQN